MTIMNPIVLLLPAVPTKVNPMPCGYEENPGVPCKVPVVSGHCTRHRRTEFAQPTTGRWKPFTKLELYLLWQSAEWLTPTDPHAKTVHTALVRELKQEYDSRSD